MTLNIRDARPDERAAVNALTLRAYAEYAMIMSPAAWAGLEAAMLSALASEERVERIVALRDETLIGSVLLYPASADAYSGAVRRASSPEVRLLAVAPEARGLGIGRALMAECVRRARNAGAMELGVHTSRSMQIAMRMYERMGFVRDVDSDFQPPGAELVQAYRLPLTEHSTDR